MLTELTKLGHLIRIVDALPMRMKTQKPSLTSPLGHVVATRLERKIMPDNLITVG